jgi:hypothetical protein
MSKRTKWSRGDLVSAGAYWSDGVFVKWEILYYPMQNIYVRENFINGRWCTSSKALSEALLIPPSEIQGEGAGR